MPKYSVDLDVLRHALFDHALAEVGESLLRAEVTSPIRIGPLALTPAGELTALVMNGAGDKDEDAVFSDRPDSHITFDMQSAWVRYKLAAKADTGVKLPFAAAKLSGHVELTDYRIHPSTASAWSAMKDDLGDPRTILDIADVRALRPGEALAMEIGGTISTTVTFSWADAISTRLAEIVDGLPANRPVAVKLKSGAETTASVKVKDHFSLVISRTREGEFRIAVKKAKSRDHTFGIEVSFGAEVSAIPAIDKALAPLFEAVTGVALDAAERAAAKIGLGELTAEEDEIVQKIAKRLGIATDAQRDAAVRDAVKDLRRKLLARLGRVAQWKASAGFAYEYARIDENSAIADFILLDDSLLEHDYDHAVAGDFGALAETLRANHDSRSIVRYLNESTLTRRSSSGFSLGIGKWTAIGTRGESAFRQTTRTSLDGLQMITSRGTRRYEEKGIAENDFEWIVDLKAQMKEFVAHPSTDSFDYGLHYMVVLERTALGEADISRILDLASVWGVRAPSMEEVVGSNAAAIGRPAAMRLQLLFDHDDLVATLGRFPQQVDGSWAVPLALAMPYMSSFAERRSHTRRRDVYTGAWTAWLRGDELSSSQWLSLLKPRIRSGLTLLEERRLAGSFLWTIGEGHAHLRDALASFVRGAGRLHEVITNAEPPAAISAAYDDLQRFWTQRLYIAASGRYLLDRAEEAGVKVTRSLQIEYGDEVVVM